MKIIEHKHCIVCRRVIPSGKGMISNYCDDCIKDIAEDKLIQKAADSIKMR